MIWQRTGLAVFTLTPLPAAVALLTSRASRRLRAGVAPTRPRGRALPALYAVAPVDAIPRLAVAPAATALGRAPAAAGCTTVASTARLARATAR
ncbi:hypothetical protein QMZ92_09010 [Streptomyces sp. HNM0645]|uniref:hypothetical protein n=1 Tax=Streptomyces sp. HNM0645 TaxID=2782343 RepID=UPI0024B857AC|nr:hypothetical protein [Streptomyces sp. HNM0645]MDI9884536.1 hypothetical protein [Streptomyces sp. HNM0645]